MATLQERIRRLREQAAQRRRERSALAAPEQFPTPGRGAPLGRLTREQKIAQQAPLRRAGRLAGLTPGGRRIAPSPLVRPTTREQQEQRRFTRLQRQGLIPAEREFRVSARGEAERRTAETIGGVQRTFEEARTTARTAATQKLQQDPRFQRLQAQLQRIRGFKLPPEEAERQTSGIQARLTSLIESSPEFQQSLAEAEETRAGAETAARAGQRRLARQLAVTGGEGIDLTQEQKVGQQIIKNLNLPEGTQAKVTAEGQIQIGEEEFEIDPFRRAERADLQERQRQTSQLNSQFKESTDRITERFAFLTGPRAGELTAQGKRLAAKLLKAKKKTTEELERKFKLAREERLIGEAERDIGKELTVAQQIAKAKNTALQDRINEKIASGEAADALEASALVQREINALGDEPDVNDAFQSFRKLSQGGKIQAGQEFANIIDIQGVDGNFSNVESVMKAAGFGPTEINKQKRDYQINVQGRDAASIELDKGIDGTRQLQNKVLSGNGAPDGTDVPAVGQNLSKLDPSGLLEEAWYRKVSTDPDANLIEQTVALANLRKIEDDRNSGKRGTIKEFNGNLWRIDGNNATLIMEGAAGEDPKIIQQRFQNQLAIKKNFDGLQIVKDARGIDTKFQILQAAFGQIGVERSIGDLTEKDIKKLGLPQGTKGSLLAIDQTLITTFNKITDPNSVVRESEYARTPGDQAFVSRWQGFTKQIAEGGAGLTDSDRAAIVRMAKIFRDKSNEKLNAQRDIFFDESQRNKLNGFFVVGEETPQVPAINGNPAVFSPITQPPTPGEVQIQQQFPQEFLDSVGQSLPTGSRLEDFDLNVLFQQSQGTRPVRNQNPINIKSGGIGDKFAKKDAQGNPVTDDQGHLIFENPEQGIKAGKADLKAKVEGRSRFLAENPTIAELGKVFAEDPNWPRAVASILGVSADTPTQEINFDELFRAVARQEGGASLLTAKV